MPLTSWLRRPAARTRLRVEQLEERAVLSAGNLDLSFGTGGAVVTDLLSPAAESGTAVAVWDAGTPADPADDKVIAVGSYWTGGTRSGFAVTRYNPDGTPDATFGTGGMVTTSFGPGDTGAAGVAVLADGRVVVAGRYDSAGDDSGSDFALAR